MTPSMTALLLSALADHGDCVRGSTSTQTIGDCRPTLAMVARLKPACAAPTRRSRWVIVPLPPSRASSALGGYVETAYAPAHRWRVLTVATWRAKQGLARNDPPSVRPSTANDALAMGPGKPLPPPLFGHWGQEMSLPCTVAPGAGAGDATTGSATGTVQAEDAEADRTKPRVAAMVLSRPGRLMDGNSTRGTRQVCFMPWGTTPNMRRDRVTRVWSSLRTIPSAAGGKSACGPVARSGVCAKTVRQARARLCTGSESNLVYRSPASNCQAVDLKNMNATNGAPWSTGNQSHTRT